MHRALLRATFGLYLVAYVLAHPHHDKLTEEEANKPVDTILWIHIFLQAMVWGVMFPLGMVLGITRSRWHVPLQVSSSWIWWGSASEFHIFLTGNWLRAHGCWLYPWPLSQRTAFPIFCPWKFCKYSFHSNHLPAGAWHLPKTAHPRKVNTAIFRCRSWDYWENISNTGMDSNIIWHHSVPGVLPRRGTRSVCNWCKSWDITLPWIQVNASHITSWEAALSHTQSSWRSFCWWVNNGCVEVDEVQSYSIRVLLLLGYVL